MQLYKWGVRIILLTKSKQEINFLSFFTMFLKKSLPGNESVSLCLTFISNLKTQDEINFEIISLFYNSLYLTENTIVSVCKDMCLFVLVLLLLWYR